MTDRTVFQCPICRTAITHPLSQLTPDRSVCLEERKPLVPEGFFSPNYWSAEYWGADGRFVVNLADLVGTQHHSIAVGKPIPLAPELGEMLWSWKLRTPYNGPNDWVFASPHKKGRQPYWPGSLFRAHVVPALKEAGIAAPVGWHTLRHTFGTLMKANGEDLKTIQEMLRHATFKVTADVYTQAITPTKREAHNKVVKLLIAEPCRSDAEDSK